MNKEIKEKWITALKSDEYKQTINCLRDEHGFCCLGVLTDLYIKEKKLNWEEKQSTIFDPIRFKFNDETAILAEEVIEWAGVKDSNPYINESDQTSVSLAEYNDHGKPFVEIADLIEKHL